MTKKKKITFTFSIISIKVISFWASVLDHTSELLLAKSVAVTRHTTFNSCKLKIFNFFLSQIDPDKYVKISTIDPWKCYIYNYMCMCVYTYLNTCVYRLLSWENLYISCNMADQPVYNELIDFFFCLYSQKCNSYFYFVSDQNSVLLSFSFKSFQDSFIFFFFFWNPVNFFHFLSKKILWQNQICFFINVFITKKQK